MMYDSCENCEYYDEWENRCTAFECYGLECPPLPCEVYDKEDS